MTYIHSNGWIENKNEVIGNILSNKLSYNQVNITDSLLCHVVDSNVVIVRGSGLFDVSLEDNGIQIKLLYTEIYSKDNEKWCLIHRHACKIN